MGDGSGVRLTWGRPVSFPAHCPARCHGIRHRLRCQGCCLHQIRCSQPNLLGLARVSIRGTGKTGHLPGRYAVGGSGGSGGVTGGGWWWWKQEHTCGNIWSCAARFGEHTPGGHKRPLLPVPINAIMAQSAKALRSDLTCVRILCVLFFFCHILLLLLSNY